MCDGHGVNGHLASKFIKDKLGQNIFSWANKYENGALVGKDKNKRYGIISKGFVKTNSDMKKQMFDINYSGSTTVSVMVYGNNIVCANVGDS